jgi:hypothetical protein
MTRYRTRREAAKHLTQDLGLPITHNTLMKLATVGGGPEYQIFGNKAVYTDEALNAWAASKLSAPRRSTSELNAQPVGGMTTVSEKTRRVTEPVEAV